MDDAKTISLQLCRGIKIDLCYKPLKFYIYFVLLSNTVYINFAYIWQNTKSFHKHTQNTFKVVLVSYGK